MFKKLFSLLIASCLAFSPLSFAASDATYFDTDTKLMLHADGADASTTFTDSSSSGKSVSANGDAQLDTAQKKFGTASGLFDGTGDYLSLANSSDWDFGTGDFTIDAWVRYTGSAPAYFTVFSTYKNGGDGLLCYITGGVIHFQHLTGGASDYDFTYSVTFNADTDYHIAFVRNGNNFYIFWGGTTAGAGTDTDGANSGGEGAVIGRLIVDADALYTTGWIDELRVVKGTAVWTSNFTPPTAAYQPVPTTSIKNINGIAYASVKSRNGLLKESMKTLNGLG